MNDALHLYEELLLLALHDKTGTVSSGYIQHALAGAVLAEMLLDESIGVEGLTRTVHLKSETPPDDPMLQRAWRVIERADKSLELQACLTEVSNAGDLMYVAVRQLCQRGIVASEEETVLFIFSRSIYPTLDPAPEQEIIARIRDVILNDAEPDARTSALISLAHHTDYLSGALNFHERAQHKARIQVVSNGDAAGPAAKQAVEACQMTVLTSIMLMSTITFIGSQSSQ